MNNDLTQKEEIIYNEIIKLQKGNDKEKSLAFECIGILGNESTKASLEDKLIIVERKIQNYYKEIKKD